jgi:hypothetical protein
MRNLRNRRPLDPKQASLVALPEGTNPNRPATRRTVIPLKEILEALLSSAHGPDLVSLYRERVLTVRTRTIVLLGRKARARIINTLLGYEVQASYKRIDCPDLVTARYLKLFSDLGCHSIKLPYDPTVTAEIIEDLELALARIAEGVRRLFPDSMSTQVYVLRRLYELIRPKLLAI